MVYKGFLFTQEKVSRIENRLDGYENISRKYVILVEKIDQNMLNFSERMRRIENLIDKRYQR